MKTVLAILVSCIISLTAHSQVIGMKIITNGDVGIGTENPVEKLDVNGAIKIGSTSSANPGSIRFNPANCDFEGYDGNNWHSLTGGSANCSGTPPVPTCSDGIQNQGETGVDCGGPCAPCSGGGSGSCESFPDAQISRSLPNNGWANQMDIGGTGITGDGELCWKVNPHIGNTQNCLGLSDNPSANASMASIDFGFQFYVRSTNNMYRVYIRENGSSRGLYINQNTDLTGSVFCIRRTGSTIEYLINGSIVYTSNSSSSGTLYFDNSYYDSSNSSIWGARPSSCHYYDVQLCPNGTYSVVTPYPESEQLSYEPDSRISQLEKQVSDLIEMISEEKAYDLEGFEVTHSAIKLELSDTAELSQNRPNPSSNYAIITYYIPTASTDASMVFYDMSGRILETYNIDHTGFGEITLDVADLPNGLYTYNLILEGKVIDAKKMNIMK